MYKKLFITFGLFNFFSQETQGALPRLTPNYYYSPQEIDWMNTTREHAAELSLEIEANQVFFFMGVENYWIMRPDFYFRDDRILTMLDDNKILFLSPKFPGPHTLKIKLRGVNKPFVCRFYVIPSTQPVL